MYRDDRSYMVECTRCGEPFYPHRSTRLSHYNGFRCPYCGQKHEPPAVVEAPPSSDVEPERQVYAVASDTAVKIGVSDNPDRRVDQLQTANAEQLELVRVWDVDNARDIEKKIHRTLEDTGCYGEWYSLSDRELSDVLRVVGQVVSDTPNPSTQSVSSSVPADD